MKMLERVLKEVLCVVNELLICGYTPSQSHNTLTWLQVSGKKEPSILMSVLQGHCESKAEFESRMKS